MRRAFLIVLVALLAALMSACRADVDVTIAMKSSGAGRFRVVFAFDKEFLTVVTSSKEGTASLRQLRAIGSQPSASGWKITQSEPGGGLRIQIERDFDDAESLQRALTNLSSEQEGAFAFLAVFRDLRIDADSGFFSNRSSVSGGVDLTLERLAPGIPLDAEIKTAFEQAAREAFRFAVKAELPGRIARHEGDPESVAGGTVVWTASLGKTLRFGAEASAVRPQAAIPAGALGIAALAAAVALVIRSRQRRRIAVPGWDPDVVESQEV